MIRKNKLWVAIILTFILASFSTSVFAWGPERATYTNEVPADHATFNSITNNAAVGDEREFVRIREKNVGNYTANTDDSGFLVEPGKSYEVYIYYHNDAASNTNETGKGVATGVKMNSHFTYKVTPDENGYVNAKIMAADTAPLEVWDELKLISNEEVDLNFVANSAVIHNGWKTDGMILVADNLFSDEGLYLGVNTLNGVVFGCAEYSGYVTYEIKANDKETPPVEPTCITNPEMEGCQEMPNTGPVEIILAAVIILGIGGGVFYLCKVKKTLKRAEKMVVGDDNNASSQQTEIEVDTNSKKDEE